MRYKRNAYEIKLKQKKSHKRIFTIFWQHVTIKPSKVADGIEGLNGMHCIGYKKMEKTIRLGDTNRRSCTLSIIEVQVDEDINIDPLENLLKDLIHQ